MRKTISQANPVTTTVRRAVTTVESISLMPIFASIDVIPAKNADNIANISQSILVHFARMVMYLCPEHTLIGGFCGSDHPIGAIDTPKS
jgi:hypothetical protein